MKKIASLILPVLLFASSCQNKKNQDTDSGNPGLENVHFFVEFTDLENSDLSEKTVEKVKARIFNHGYVLTTETNEWQGVKEIDTLPKSDLKNLEIHHPNIHRFKDFSEYFESDQDFEKIEINFNQRKDSLPNFNMHTYKKLGHSEWQSVSNPGNFRFDDLDHLNEDALADWMVTIIVLMTYK